jgi:uncharacterized protein
MRAVVLEAIKVWPGKGEACRKFQIPDQLVEGYGYPKLTPEIKAKVFGLNAARIWSLKTA